MTSGGSAGDHGSVADDVAAAPGDLFEGDRLGGQYEIEGPLGDGGVGAVYRARHLPSQRHYALKLLKSHARTSTLERRFQREARALGALEHPNIVAIVDDGFGAVPYLVMDLVEGQSLAALLGQGLLATHRVFAIAEQLLSALVYVHGRKLVHRDLKPANVLLEDNAQGVDRVKLVDFGFAKFIEPTTQSLQEDLTRTGEIFGTPGYMAPEQVGGDSSDPRTDLYAVGVILFEMLAGRRPFEGSMSHVLRGHLAEPPPTLAATCPLRGSTPALEALLARALEKEPGDRFASAQEFADALAQIDRQALEAASGDLRTLSIAPTMEMQAAEPRSDMQAQRPAGSARPDAPGQDRAHPADRNRRRLASIAVGAVLLAAAGLYMARSGHDGATATARGGRDLPSATSVTPPAPHASAAEAPNVAAGPAAPTGDPQARDEGQAADAPVDPPEVAAAPPAPLPIEPPLAAAPQRPRAVNPWARSIPKPLRYIRTFTERGEEGSEQTITTLRRYNRVHPEDPRGHLLLAQLYLNRGWRADALAQYRFAYTTDPACRGASGMLDGLLSLASHRALSPEASALVIEAYGSEALATIDRALARKGPDSASGAALRRLRAAIADPAAP